MIRRVVVLLALGLATTLAVAPGALAQGPVHVEADEMLEVSGTNTIAIQVHTGMGEADVLRCEVGLEVTGSEDGSIHVHDINFSAAAGSTPNCSGANDCGVEWTGQIFKDTSGDLKGHFSFCTNRTGSGEVTCDVDANGGHCDSVPVEGSATAEIDGELNFGEPVLITDA